MMMMMMMIMLTLTCALWQSVIHKKHIHWQPICQYWCSKRLRNIIPLWNTTAVISYPTIYRISLNVPHQDHHWLLSLCTHFTNHL